MKSPTEIPTAEKPFSCLVIQLGQLGDTLQSLMALRAAKQLYPGMEIHYVCRESSASAVKRVPWIDQVITFPATDILDPVLDGSKSEREALTLVARWIGPVARRRWDFVINWSYTESSSFLAGLLPAKVKLGYSRRKDTSFSSVDGWSHYIQAIVQGGVHQNIHLTDILTTQLLTALQIHVGDPVDCGNAPVTSKNFFELELDSLDSDWAWKDFSKKWIAIQLGAGHRRQRWGRESWQALVGLILERDPEWNIVLLGGENDRMSAQQLIAGIQASQPENIHRITSLVGKTDFDLWSGVIARCQWLMASDTASLHLASVLGTRVVNVSVGPVRWMESGPYGNGHYVICSNAGCTACESSQPDGEHACVRNVTPEAVYGLWSFGASEWARKGKALGVSISREFQSHFEELGWESKLPLVRAFRSRIRPSGEGGGVFYEPLITRPLTLADWTAMAMGHIARAWYCGWVPPVGHELFRGAMSPALLQRIRELDESTQVLAKICGEAILTALNLSQKSSTLKSEKLMDIADRAELNELGKKLVDLDRLIDRLAKSHGPLDAFSRMSKVLMNNLSGDHLSEISKESVEAYRQLNEGVLILREWVKHTLSLAKPVAVQSVPAPNKEYPLL